MRKHTISCIIPAYNEGRNIRNILAVVDKHPLIDEIVVVDDGSKDDTAAITRSFPAIRLITHKKKSGKSKAVLSGINASKGDILLLVDADLLGLTQEYLSDLIIPVIFGKADIAMSLRKFKPVFDYIYERIIGFDPLSGERIFKRSLVEQHLNELASLPDFGLEVFLNKLIITQKSKLSIVPWESVATPTKAAKYGRSGIRDDIKMHRDVLEMISPFKYIGHILRMRKLKVPGDIKVSLVIPAYNEERYIGACLAHAIQNSDGFFHEIIVIDNASTDKTGEIARSFPGVNVVREDKKGLSQARQRGLIESTGDILAYIDADTRMPRGWLQMLLKEFQRKKTVGLSGRYIYYDFPESRRFWVSIYNLVLVMPTYWMTGFMMFGGNFAIRRTTLEQMGGFDTTIEFYGEDTDIARRASKFGKVKFMYSFAMPTSARRLQNQGILKTACVYVLNFLHEVLLKKPATGKHEDYR